MIDLEKVIKGLECLITNEVPCEGCPYNGSGYCLKNIAKDARWLLKEMEPVPRGKRIKAGDVVLRFYECGHCKNAIRKPWRYCPFCGREVKWDGFDRKTLV